MAASTISNRFGCDFINGFGDNYVDFSCIDPWLKRSYQRWEVGYDPTPLHNWINLHPELPIATVILYAILIFIGKQYMKDRPAWKCPRFLAFWNLSLSIFSFIGTIRVLPNIFHAVSDMPTRDLFCANVAVTFGSGSTGLWLSLFVMSKFPELLDTFFIVVNKKQLIFLHWYHHITVLLYSWFAYAAKSPTGAFFTGMNYAVHAMMYFYYFLTTIKMKPKSFRPIYVTTAQISQMFVGVTVSLMSFYYYSTVEEECTIKRRDVMASFLMYGSYLILFLQFFVGRYFEAKVISTSLKKKI